MSEVEATHHFGTFDKEAHAGRLGMWIFLASEILLFTGMFTVYTAGRVAFPESFAVGVTENLRWLGTLNTFVLITSSFFVAAGVHALRNHNRKLAAWCLGLTVFLGFVFLLLKGYEYADHIHKGAVPTGITPFYIERRPLALKYFFTLYYVMTGAHAVHVIVGMLVLAVLLVLVLRRRPDERMAHRVEIGALYWHLVDVIWIFLWPLFYLTGGGH